MGFDLMTIQEIKEWLTKMEPKAVQSALHKLELDERKGVQQLLKGWHLQQQKNARLKERWKLINKEENLLRSRGISYIAGIDEVGRGPLAGPVVAAAVILPNNFYHLGIDDSKKLSAYEREAYAEIIRQEAIAYSVSSVDSAQIDQVNIYQATLKSMLQAVEQLSVSPQFLLIDAMQLAINIPQKSITKGDSHSVSIAAASILAKVHRDKCMTEISAYYPEYGFERNMGYATKEHIKALERYGVTPLHRRSFLNNFTISNRTIVG